MFSSRLRLITLTCKQTEDFVKPDEPFISVNGKKVWSGNMSGGDIADLSNLPEIMILQSALITLFDDNTRILNDDFLGTAYAFSNMSNFGKQKAVFTGDGADYELTFRVFKGLFADQPQTDSSAEPEFEPPISDFIKTLSLKAESLAGVPIVANEYSFELHRLSCRHASKINFDHRYPKKGAMDGRNAVGYILNGYDGCFYCLKEISFTKERFYKPAG